MPAAAALDQFDAPAGVDFRKRLQRRRDVALTGVTLDVLDGQRLGRGENRRFNCPGELVHQAARTFSGVNGPSCRMSSRPRRASSSAATKLDARAERR